MDINEIREQALQHGIIILDYEDRATLRGRVADTLGIPDTTVTDEQIRLVTDEVYASQEDIVLLTETADGEASVARCVRAAIRSLGMGGPGEDEEDDERGEMRFE